MTPARAGNPFFEAPILNSPYERPSWHWELDDQGQPTQRKINTRRDTRYVSPIPRPRKQSTADASQNRLAFSAQPFDPTPYIREVRLQIEAWRTLPNSADWLVTPETARLLQHWRDFSFGGVRPFFCQVEAAEVAIWLTEVAPKLGNKTKNLLNHLANANAEANPGLHRLALKLATGAGKTTVMAMLIAWQTINAVRHPESRLFTRGFLVVTPGITIKDRLRVLQPNDSESYYVNRELVPTGLAAEINKAKIVITNYHAFKLRETLEISKVGRQLLQGRTGAPIQTLETEGQMIQRVMSELAGLKSVMVLNDEAHHCYREKAKTAEELAEEEESLKGDDREEAKRNKEAARCWISGLEAVNRQLGVARVMDLSATPFFLRGSGYPEGTLFHWTMSDFSLMDAIECGIVKLPRVPVADNIPGDKVPVFRNLWEHIRTRMPKKGRGQAEQLDPLKIPLELQTALEALYGHYRQTFDLWTEKKIGVPPCFIVVCNNTSTSKLVYDYISGFYPPGDAPLENGRLELFRNFDEYGNKFARPRTILIDSEQLESGEALDDTFREAAAGELERFRQEVAAPLTDQEILREVMNTVGKPGKLGGGIRCVVSVSMLTEGWDTNTVTHILGVRAFGTQLLCEQVIGRALRRQSYEPNDKGLFNVEYADILGIPFDFTAQPVISAPHPPPQTIQVRAVRPDRDALEIRFPRVSGYRVELPNEQLEAAFTPDSVLILTPDVVRAPSVTQNFGIIGEGVDLTLAHLRDMRSSTLLLHLTKHLVYTKWRDQNEEARLALFGQLKRIAKEWLDHYLECKGDTYPAQLMHRELADMACDRITAAITKKMMEYRPVKVLLDPYNPTGSSRHVRFNTSKPDLYQTAADKCHVNYVVLDSTWEAELCRVIESHPQVKAYVKNHNLGFEVPYLYGGEPRRYFPDFIVVLEDDLHLIVEVKGFRREDAKVKKETMDAYWILGVNNSGRYGRWAFAEFGDVYAMESDLNATLTSEFEKLIEHATKH